MIIKRITLKIKEIICCVKISKEFKETRKSHLENFIIVFLCHLWYYASMNVQFLSRQSTIITFCRVFILTNIIAYGFDKFEKDSWSYLILRQIITTFSEMLHSFICKLEFKHIRNYYENMIIHIKNLCRSKLMSPMVIYKFFIIVP